MKLSINLNDELVQAIDDYAKEKYINRTSAICVLITNALQTHNMNKGLSSLNDINKLLNDK